MGLTRNSEGWTSCYRYLLSPLQGQIPFSAFPVNDVIPSAESCRQESVPTYSEFQALCPTSFSIPYSTSSNSSQQYHHPLEVHPGPESGGSVSVLQPCTVPSYLPPFSDVNSLYNYNLDHYGSSNVGAAVAMSLASMSSAVRESEPQEMHQQTSSEHHQEELVCSEIQHTIQQTNTGEATSQNVEVHHSEYLLSELLGGDPELLGICRNADGSSTYKNSVHSTKDYAENTIQPGLTETNYVTGITEKEWVKNIQKDEVPMSDPQNFDLNLLYMNIPEERNKFFVNDSSVAVQKKYQLYGKWRPSNVTDTSQEKSQVNNEDFQAQDQTNYILQTSTDTNRYQEPTVSYDRLQTRTALLGQSESSCSSLGDRVGDSMGYNPYSGESFVGESGHLSEDDDDSKDEDRVSKDEKRARALKLPLSNYEIIMLPIDEFNERISKFELTDPQLSLIRDIRRRGKNKVAAQNCRKRKLDQIFTLQKEVETLHLERGHLQHEQEQLVTNLQFLKDKYYRLCQVIGQSDNRRQQSPELQQILVSH